MTPTSRAVTNNERLEKEGMIMAVNTPWGRFVLAAPAFYE
jgi:hypothetical protein